MEKVSLALRNIIKILWWIFLSITLTRVLGTIYGVLLFIGIVLAWGIVLTIIREYFNNERNKIGLIIKTIFTTSPTLPFTAYGCYCSPKYGADGRTKGLEPIDGLDKACAEHDDEMLIANDRLGLKLITKQEYVKLKNKGDWRFMRNAMTSPNSASGIYLILLEIGFLFRIISRVLTNK